MLTDVQRPHRIEPGPGQESVWDYPRPPVAVPSSRGVRVVHAGVVLADTTRAVRVLETSQPPAWYLPRDDVALEHLRPSPGARTWCEWKGEAAYFDVVVGDVVVPQAAWTYPAPVDRFAAIAGHVAFYAQRVDACFVDDEQVQANAGDFYGGWVTSDVVGPFKGGPGTLHW